MTTSWIPGAADLPINRGPHVRSPDRPPDRSGFLANGANAYLQNPQGFRVGMWVNEITADFELAGTTAQGPTQRDFYPHNFTQPSLTIGGQTTNNFEYNRLADFIRQSQLDALTIGPSSFPLRFICLTPRGVQTPTQPIMRGRHNRIHIEGFVAKTKKGATRFVTAHTYRFDFVILAAKSFLGLEDQITSPFQTMQTIGQRLEAGRSRLAYHKPGKPNASAPGTPPSKQDDSRPTVQPASSIIGGIDPHGPFGPITG